MKSLILAFLSLLVALELAGAIWFWVGNSGLVYFQEPPAAQQANTAAATSDTLPTNFRLHPYFGFILKPKLSLEEYLPTERVSRLIGPGYDPSSPPEWLKIATNSNGFFSKYDYPYKPSQSDEVVIGIFGGSVAHWLAIQGSDALSELLKQSEQFNGRKIVVLNFAAGGYKQPQQLLLLNYYLALGQPLDIAVNIDGFNEITLAAINIEAGIAPNLPSSQHLNTFKSLIDSNTTSRQTLITVADLIQRRDQESILSRKRSEARLGSEFLIHDLRLRFKRWQIANLESEVSLPANPAAESILYLNQIQQQSLDSGKAAELASLWRSSSQLMAQVAERNNIQYLHILQPNQYHSKKVFSPAEDAIARAGDSIYRANATVGYPALIEQGRVLAKGGVRFFDATSIFDSVSEQVYSDNCCHYNQLGNELLAQTVAREIIATR